MNIGITGGIGSGKSRVTAALADLLGVAPLSADSICRELLEVGCPAYLQLRNLVGPNFFLTSGELDRSGLRKAIFSNKILRHGLDAILHPLVRQEILHSITIAKTNKQNSITEVPLLFEKGWQGDFDYSLVVSASKALCVSRIVERDLVTEEAARLAIDAQMSLEVKCQLGDRVVDNSGSFEKTLSQLKQFASEISRQPLFF